MHTPAPAPSSPPLHMPLSLQTRVHKASLLCLCVQPARRCCQSSMPQDSSSLGGGILGVLCPLTTNWGLQTIGIYSFPVPGTRSVKPRCHRAELRPEALLEEPSCLFRLLGAPAVPGPMADHSNPCLCSLVLFSAFVCRISLCLRLSRGHVIPFGAHWIIQDDLCCLHHVLSLPDDDPNE